MSLLVNAGIAALVHGMQDRLPGSDALWEAGDYAPSLDAVRGAFWTAFLFSAGQLLLGLYLGRGAFGNAYGAAGSFVVLLVWIYYSSQVFLFGAELTQVLARRRGAAIVPKAGAVVV